jgi:pimeloyl-[acyl-carrier protein] methyl ester esterase
MNVGTGYEKSMNFLRKQHLVLMPGLDGTGLSFEPLLPLIPVDTKVTVIRYPTDKLLSFEETVECAAAQITATDPPVVIAESFSGPVAVQMIGSGRIRAKYLVLCATFARSPHPLVWRIIRLLRIHLLLGPDMPKLFFKFILGDDQFISVLEPLWKKVHANVPAALLGHRLDIINKTDVTCWLSKISIPCLYLQATDDQIVPASCVISFQRGIPNLTVKKLKTPHFILQARPQACLDAIEEFINLVAPK